MVLYDPLVSKSFYQISMNAKRGRRAGRLPIATGRDQSARLCLEITQTLKLPYLLWSVVIPLDGDRHLVACLSSSKIKDPIRSVIHDRHVGAIPDISNIDGRLVAGRESLLIRSIWVKSPFTPKENVTR